MTKRTVLDVCRELRERPSPWATDEMIDALVETIEAVQALHQCHDPIDNQPDRSVAAHCVVCAEQWPCGTARILTSEIGESEHD